MLRFDQSMNHNDPCDHMESCPLYSLFDGDASLSLWQMKYCVGEYRKCVRWRKALRQEPVPINLLPNGKSLGK